VLKIVAFFCLIFSSAKDSNQDEQREDSKKSPRISFSDFLDKKLHKSSVLPKTVKVIS
jgi:hypothetical protein